MHNRYDENLIIIPIAAACLLVVLLVIGPRIIPADVQETVEIIDWTLVEQSTSQSHVRKGTLHLTTRRSASTNISSRSASQMSMVPEWLLSLISNKKEDSR